MPNPDSPPVGVDPPSIENRKRCTHCRGRGWHRERMGTMTGEFPCLDCNGTGYVEAHDA